MAQHIGFKLARLPRLWRAVIDELLFTGFLSEKGDMLRPVIGLGDADEVRALWKGDREVRLKADPAARRERRSKRAAKGGLTADLSERDQALFEALRSWRLEEAKTRGVPPYVIFHDRTLAEISPEKKAAVSHRGEAFRALRAFLQSGWQPQTDPVTG